MAKVINATPEAADYWDGVANLADPEAVPAEIHDVGGFEYLVAPQETVGERYRFGGYDITDTETGEITSRVIVGDELPKHVRGLIVAHLVMHKAQYDTGEPQMCGHLDKSIQAVLAEAEPDLIIPFYDEARNMYQDGLDAFIRDRGIEKLVIARYARGLENSRTKGRKARASEETQLMLKEAGLVLPSDEIALTGIDRRNGLRTSIKLQTERQTKHKCRECSHPIVKGSQRITTATKQEHRGYDHHHYHPGCFTHLELGTFTDLQEA